MKRTNILKAGVIFTIITLLLSGTALGTNLGEKEIEVADKATSDCGCCEGCVLEIKKTMPPGISWRITNIGDSDCINVTRSINFVGGIILVGRETSEVIPCISPGKSVYVTAGWVLGFGRTIITFSVEADGVPPITDEQKAFVFLFFIIIGP